MRVWMKRIFLLSVMACYLAFAYLLYTRWLATELAAGGPVTFDALVRKAGERFVGADGEPRRRVSWIAVLTPLWVADGLTVIAHLSLLAVQHAWRPLATSLNARIEHASGAARAVLYGVFKALLVQRLAPPTALAADEPPPTPISWWLVFTPIYAAAIVQVVLHSCKTLEGGEALFRGRDQSRPRRRPGFALTLDDTLAFNISLHLSGGARRRL